MTSAPNSFIAQALAAWQATSEAKAKRTLRHDLSWADRLLADVDRLMERDPRPPELDDWPALTAACDAEMAECDTGWDAETQAVLIFRRPRPCGHRAQEGVYVRDCPFCVLLTYTASVSRDLRRHELGEAHRFSVTDPSPSPQVTALGCGTGMSTPSPSPAEFPSSRILMTLALLAEHGPQVKTATEWGNALLVSPKRAAVLLRDVDALAAYGLLAREQREGHTGRRLFYVARLTEAAA